MQRSVILKILRPYDDSITWEDMGYLLRGLSYKVCRISNYCMTHHLLRALKLETQNLNPQGHLYCYPRLVQEYPEVPAGIICAAESRTRKVFRQKAAEILSSKTALPSFRKDISIPIPVDSYSLQKEGENTYFVNIQLLSRKGAKTQKLPGRIKLVLVSNWRDKTAGKALQQLTEGALKRGIASVFRKNRDWYVSIPYTTEPVHQSEDFEPGLVMGVAFGTKCALSYAFNHSLKRGEIGGEEVLAHQDKYLARRKHIQEQYKWSGRKGHGRKAALKPLRLLYEKERNYRNLTNERYAKWIIEIAAKNCCGILHIETAEAIQGSKQEVLLSRWPQEELWKKIRMKAEEYGITVLECPDAAIRKRCSRCGAIQEDGAGKTSFVCSACGYGKEENKTGAGFVTRDYNAARRLAVWEAKP